MDNRSEIQRRYDALTVQARQLAKHKNNARRDEVNRQMDELARQYATTDLNTNPDRVIPERAFPTCKVMSHCIMPRHPYNVPHMDANGRRFDNDGKNV